MRSFFHAELESIGRSATYGQGDYLTAVTGMLDCSRVIPVRKWSRQGSAIRWQPELSHLPVSALHWGILERDIWYF